MAPPLLLTGYAAYCATIHLPILLMLIAVWFWGIRLTANWAYTFHNLQEEDWRYVMYRERCPKTWHLVNFMGINMMPTVVVFIAMIPAILLIELDPIRANISFIVGYIISVAAAGLQWEADRQAHRFRRENPGKVCSTGLWKYSRHPNYLGEILMWWGVGIMYVAFVPSHWYVFLGALIVTCLFIFISIPMMEKRQLARKPEYASYKEKTRML
jgi:steroid 5-alpha reductase family enzyme